jgi:signal transduction histidine kinase
VKSEEAISNSNDLLSKFILHSPIYTYIKEVTPDESKVLKASDNFIDMIGIPGSQMIGKNMYELFPPEFARKITAEDWEVASNDHLIQLDEELNGRYYLTIKYPIKQANRTLLAGYTIDITDRKLAEDAFKENEIRLREVNATKDKFFSIIAHDLKSPFNSILGLSNLLVEQMQERNYDGIEEYAGIIQKSSTIVFDLLINLLEWARLQTGRMEFSPEYVEIGSLINEAAELLRDSARGKSITISSEIPRKTIAFGDRTMISAILRNLITNAVKFTHPGGQVVISVKQKVDELEICVQDNGVGIKREAIEKLFMIDETHTSLGTKNEKGTGLGLILCKEFIDKHDGKIWVESEVGKGSKFYFSIPKH